MGILRSLIENPQLEAMTKFWVNSNICHSWRILPITFHLIQFVGGKKSLFCSDWLRPNTQSIRLWQLWICYRCHFQSLNQNWCFSRHPPCFLSDKSRQRKLPMEMWDFHIIGDFCGGFESSWKAFATEANFVLHTFIQLWKVISEKLVWTFLVPTVPSCCWHGAQQLTGGRERERFLGRLTSTTR